MYSFPELTVMLTHNDMTVENAYEIFDLCKETSAMCWGMKEEPLKPDEMIRLYSYMKKCGKKTFLEVVCYDEESSYAGAELGASCGCDYLMGTVYSDRINELCRRYNMKYLPFVGDIEERPSVLRGTPEKMISEAKSYLEKGVYGFDLLGYRYTGDAVNLINRFVHEVPAPVCVAGSVDSYQRLEEIRKINPWSFTVGSAFFDKCFGDSIPEQIENVCRYIKTGGVNQT